MAKEARKTVTFWKLGSIQFLFFSALMTIPVHIAIHGIDLGMSPAKASLLLSAIGFASIAGRIVVGFSGSTWSKGYLYNLFLSIDLKSICMRNIYSYTPLYYNPAVWFFSHGSFFTVVSPAVKEYFGMKSHGDIFGNLLFLGTIGGAICPIIAGQSLTGVEVTIWHF